jgi:hypothetical protein
MNELTIEPTTAAPGRRRRAPNAGRSTERSAADLERGVALFILAAASFFESAAKKPKRGRRRAKAGTVATNRRTTAKRVAAKPQ